MRCVCQDGAASSDLIAAHLLSLLLVAPELAAAVPVPPELRASFAFSREGNLPEWTARIAHGVTDFLLACFAGRGGTTVAFRHADAADPTDREFIAILRRRANSIDLNVRVDDAASETDDTASVAAARALLTAGTALWCGENLDRADDDAAVLLHASDLCMRMAYYDAALEWAERGRLRLAATSRTEEYGKLLRNALFALMLLGRHAEVETVCIEAERRPLDPALLAHVSYARAILLARLYPPAKHDYDAARAWIERSLDCTDQLPPSETRAVNRAFLMNTLALVEMRQDRHAAALNLLDSALTYMEQQAPTKVAHERGILLHNRARLHNALKQPEQALADLTRLLDGEPSDSDALLDRGLLHQRAMRFAEAMADYGGVLRWSPPYWQPHFNRAQVLVALGRLDDALADYERASELHPDHAEMQIKAQALCVRGLIAMRSDDLAAGVAHFTAAIEADPNLADAWANRASICFKQGDAEAALRDLDQALMLREDGEILYNRARMLESLLRWHEAAADYRTALTLGAAGADEIRARLDRCLQEAAQNSSQNPHGQPAEPAV